MLFTTLRERGVKGGIGRWGGREGLKEELNWFLFHHLTSVVYYTESVERGREGLKEELEDGEGERG